MSYTPTTWQTGDTITAEKLNKLEQGVSEAGGSSLPAVTATDNGDVLTVVEGTWANAAPSGGLFVVDVTLDETTQALTASETFGAIKAAFLAGKHVVCCSPEEDEDGVWRLYYEIFNLYTSPLEGGGGSFMVFLGVDSTTQMSAESDSSYPSDL